MVTNLHERVDKFNKLFEKIKLGPEETHIQCGMRPLQTDKSAKTFDAMEKQCVF